MVLWSLATCGVDLHLLLLLVFVLLLLSWLLGLLSTRTLPVTMLASQCLTLLPLAHPLACSEFLIQIR